MADPNPAANASVETATPTVELDPSASDAVSVVQPEQPPMPEEEPLGPIGRGIEGLIPESGNRAVDESVETLSRSVASMIDTTVAYLPQVVIAIIVLIVTGLIVAGATTIAARLFRKARLRGSLRDLFVLLIRVGIWFVGIMVAASIVFPNFGFGQLVATAGLTSIALGFAFQDIFENAFAGVLILWRFPFEIGDFIEIPDADIMGQVEDVEIRMTQLRTTAGELLLVPNSTIYKNVVNVLTDQNARRMTVMCGIAYGEDVAEGREVIRKAVQGCPSVREDYDVEIFAQAFGASSIDFEVTWWTGSTPLDQRKSRDQVVEAVKAALDEAGIEIPYPYRTLTFSRNEPDIIEAVRGHGRGVAEANDEAS
jgi:small-conductance mechanosensitive channel